MYPGFYNILNDKGGIIIVLGLASKTYIFSDNVSKGEIIENIMEIIDHILIQAG